MFEKVPAGPEQTPISIPVPRKVPGLKSKTTGTTQALVPSPKALKPLENGTLEAPSSVRQVQQGGPKKD